MGLYKAWQRDVLLFKSVALANLAYIYLLPFYESWRATGLMPTPDWVCAEGFLFLLTLKDRGS
jgi:hypothetical protein